MYHSLDSQDLANLIQRTQQLVKTTRDERQKTKLIVAMGLIRRTCQIVQQSKRIVAETRKLNSRPA
jgi:hypothetical protein